MGLPLHALSFLKPYMTGKKVLSLGYPDLLVGAKEIEGLFGYTPTKVTNANVWHKRKEPLPETFELFERLGSELTVVDFTAETGREKIADLNYPQSLGEFDLVIDSGTLEHCFNIGQAFMNAAGAVKAGGMIFHISPMDMMNHGFYNLNTTLFSDFYGQNGWKVLDVKVVTSKAPNVQETARFDMHMEHVIRVLAQRQDDSPLKFPIQTKYLLKMKQREEKK